ncbi:MbtH family NRPS accessory protein [Planotetraspora sp. A-T 1434]|uniref:MbtH family protein n=1 Tax=Planotetraspora sp. A-T 1434 TaxID=2979219 RepID=UPI0021BE1F61|nr:MbtH family NRPS accessory protein [Planotetraspora sp. A-T 1434]MCT9935406.1 MbtH family NRPS accessory protein [Planotetraspora sp. A-T 1434]
MNDEFIVVINDEGQYSIWPAGRGLPRGWSDVGRRGDKESCLAYIDQTWTDMRPLSLVRAMRPESGR